MVSLATSTRARSDLTIAKSLAARLAGLMFVFGLAGPLQAAEEILDFDAAIVVRSDGVLDVTETIRVRAEGDQIKRGIFRDFPLTFVGDDGKSRQVEFELLGVTRDGKPEPYHTARNGKGVRIYAGEQDVILPAGIHVYSIHYETGRQLVFAPDHTELFWNVTGNEWAFPILSATALVTLPDGRPPQRWTAYTGSYGERGEDFSGRILGDNVLSVATTRPLAPGEGISVVVDIPKGLVAPPSGAKALFYWFLDNRRYILGGFGFFGVLFFYVSTWNAVGRDPPKGTIIPQFHPPAGISPALAGYIRNWGWRGGWRGFTAATISLAVKGVVVFDDLEDKIIIKRRGEKLSRDALQKLPPGERAVMKWVDGRGGSVTVNKASGKSIANAFTSFKSAVEGENRGRFFKRNVGYFVLGLAMTIAAIVLVLIFGGLDEAEIGFLIVVTVICVFLGIFIVPLARAIFGARRDAKSISKIAINVAVPLVFFGIFLSAGITFVRALPDDISAILLFALLLTSFPVVLVGGFATLNGLFFYLLRAPTAAGRKIMDDIEGLELYIRTAETGRLNAADAPDLDADRFERLLPYAVALGVEKPWSEAFATAFARAHPGKAVTNAYTPAWHGGRAFSGKNFGSSVSSTMSSAQTSFVSAVPARSSSRSGFSSSGGSGGGGGGGGGGGW